MKRTPLKRKTPLRAKSPKRIAAGQASQSATRAKRGIPDDAPLNESGKRCAEVVCLVCGTPYLAQWSQREFRKTCSKECANKRKRKLGRERRGKANPNYKGGQRVGVRDRSGERRWRTAQQSECAHPACPNRNASAVLMALHHVVYAQKIRREGGDVWDPRNGLTLCQGCHSSHHQRGSRVVPLTTLTTRNLDFAFEVLGAAAYDYLRLRYAGEDSRLKSYLDRYYPEEATA